MLFIKTVFNACRRNAQINRTSLQQDASNKFGMTSPETMLIAQHLYEGMDVGGDHIALITYIHALCQQ